MNDVMAAQVQAYLAPAEIDALIQDHAKGVAAASETARATFEAAATAAGAASTWRNIPGEDHHSLIACARRCDLTVAPPRIQVSCSRTAISAGDLSPNTPICALQLFAIPNTSASSAFSTARSCFD
jgi:hypothetical protein